MNEIIPQPFGDCDVCGKPLEYEANPNWAEVKHLFRLNPSRGYWLPKEHAYCSQRSAEATQREKEKRARQERDGQIRRAMSELGFPQIQTDKPFETFHVGPGNQRAHQAMQSWTYTKTGILLYGPPGRGKSHLTAAFAKRWTEMGMNVAFVTMSGLLALLRRGFDESLFDERLHFVSSQVQILVLDDLGAEKRSDWTEEKLYEIVDTRLTAGLPLFVTTNCSEAELETKFHPRILSRLKEMCVWVGVDGEDYRNRIKQSREQAGPRTSGRA
jgi:DNA replication protein DnaC